MPRNGARSECAATQLIAVLEHGLTCMLSFGYAMGQEPAIGRMNRLFLLPSPLRTPSLPINLHVIHGPSSTVNTLALVIHASQRLPARWPTVTCTASGFG